MNDIVAGALEAFVSVKDRELDEIHTTNKFYVAPPTEKSQKHCNKQ